MLDFLETEQSLLLVYEPEQVGPTDWIETALDEGGLKISRTFYLTRNDLLDDPQTTPDEDSETERGQYTFKIGALAGDYYRIPSRILSIEHDLYLSTELEFDKRKFVAHRNVSIFRHMDDLVKESIYVGGGAKNAIPIAEFDRLVNEFPGTTELDRYASARVARILKDYIGTTTQAERLFEDYLNRRSTSRLKIESIPSVYEFERRKYEFIRDDIIAYLKEENSFSEDQWRDLMLQFILLIFPKYVAVLKNVRIKDYYSSAGHSTNRYIDIALIDANGNLDIIEIKKPFSDCLASEGKYRGNFTPRKELSGTIMQVEKYLFHLSKWGVAGEKDINDRQSKNLPSGLSVKITNPKGIVIAGRSNNLSGQQLFDFELIKRKYANVMDILSYDDLLNRLSNIIEKFETP